MVVGLGWACNASSQEEKSNFEALRAFFYLLFLLESWSSEQEPEPMFGLVCSLSSLTTCLTTLLGIFQSNHLPVLCQLNSQKHLKPCLVPNKQHHKVIILPNVI